MVTLASSYMNLQSCSLEFQAAIAALDRGMDVRRSGWPRGQFLRLEPSGLVAIYREGLHSTPSWAGTCGTAATDWVVVS